MAKCTATILGGVEKGRRRWLGVVPQRHQRAARHDRRRVGHSFAHAVGAPVRHARRVASLDDQATTPPKMETPLRTEMTRSIGFSQAIGHGLAEVRRDHRNGIEGVGRCFRLFERWRPPTPGIPEDQMARIGRSFALNMCWFLLKNHLTVTTP